MQGFDIKVLTISCYLVGVQHGFEARMLKETQVQCGHEEQKAGQ